jgi:hypothetical protein
MSQLLIELARRIGCEDLHALAEVLRGAGQRQGSLMDDILDAGLVNEENYEWELAVTIDGQQLDGGSGVL